MPAQFTRALDNGVTAAELSEIITHLAFYAGWAQRDVGRLGGRPPLRRSRRHREELPASDEPQLPLDEATETQRRNTVEQNYGAVAPDVLQYIP